MHHGNKSRDADIGNPGAIVLRRRALDLRNVIDPGFVNHRLIETILGSKGVDVVDRWSEQIPTDIPAPLRQVRVDHVYARALLTWSKINDVPTLRQALVEGQDRVIVTATERVGPFPGVYTKARGENRLKLGGFSGLKVVLRYSTDKVWSSTLRAELRKGFMASFVGTLARDEDGTVVIQPAVMGPPWVESEAPGEEVTWAWWSWEFYEQFIEDIDEFAKVQGFSSNRPLEDMSRVSERAFKSCLATLLAEDATKDWGGEQADYFTAHLHLAGRRTTAGFVLKGPAKFHPMALNMLGKNNDQIYRLAQLPAGLLVVQHCHEILPAVRATLRAFAVQPGNPRRYCLIDGHDSLRLLDAYGLYDDAVRLTEQERSERRRTA